MNRATEISDRVQDQSSSTDEDVPSVQYDPQSNHSSASYRISLYSFLIMNHNLITRKTKGSLLDRGANGGLIGADAIPFHIYRRLVDVTGIDEHALAGLPICDAAGKVLTHRGWVIAIWQQMCLIWKGHLHHIMRTDGTLW